MYVIEYAAVLYRFECSYNKQFGDEETHLFYIANK